MSIAIILIAVLLDRVTKTWAVSALKGQEAIELLPGVFQFNYVENSGAAFSFLSGQRALLLVITFAILAVVLFFLFRGRKEPLLYRISLAMVAGGAVGNLIDRIAYGYVVDFLDFNLIHYPVFNVADCFVVVGAILLCVYFLFFQKEEK